MYVDLYNKARNEPAYNKLVGNGYTIAEYKCPVDTEQFQTLSEAHFIIYIVTGRKDWTIAGKTYPCHAGDALFVRRGVYSTRQFFDEDNCVMFFFMNDDFIRNFIRENSSLPGGGEVRPGDHDMAFRLDVNDVLRNSFRSVYDYLHLGTNIPEQLVELKFKELMYNIVLNANHQALTQYLYSVNHGQRTHLDDVMLAHFSRDLELEDFARLAGRSLSAFKRDFKNHYARTPGEWIKDKRLDYARTLLVSSDLNVNEICYESGFRNTAHFNKVFKTRYQLPPQQFRTQHRQVVSA